MGILFFILLAPRKIESVKSGKWNTMPEDGDDDDSRKSHNTVLKVNQGGLMRWWRNWAGIEQSPENNNRHTVLSAVQRFRGDNRVGTGEVETSSDQPAPRPGKRYPFIWLFGLHCLLLKGASMGITKNSGSGISVCLCYAALTEWRALTSCFFVV